jgi:hypothetical protein
MTTVPDTVRMSHRTDPHTSKEAAVKASTGTKKALLYGAILALLEQGPLTPSEVSAEYEKDRRRSRGAWLPEADLYDIRRRMSELEHDHKRIEPTYGRRAGQRVMRLVVES